jgi:hypothetical protein
MENTDSPGQYIVVKTDFLQLFLYTICDEISPEFIFMADKDDRPIFHTTKISYIILFPFLVGN